MFVKICGIRDVDTARSVADCGPDAIGLNFYRQSSRWLDIRMAERICRALPSSVEPVGVFVNHTLEEILEVTKNCRITTAQLHGDETPQLSLQLIESGLEVIRAIRVDEENVGQLPDLIAQYDEVPLRAILIDARIAGFYGGSGHTVPWQSIAAAWQCNWPPLILAGGLTPANISEAISRARPWGVDTAGGVESSPAIKDPAKVRSFIDNARTGSR